MNKDAIYKLLQLNKNTSITTFKRLRKIKGLDCYIHPPVTNGGVTEGSIFGLEDLVEYEDEDIYSDKVLIFNLFQEGTMGMDQFDTFYECFALTLYEERYKLQTLIEIDLYGRTMTFKVDDHKNITPTIGDQLFIKNILVPAT